jgi:hypothetical protein
MPMHGKPLFLFWIAKSYQENIWARRLNPPEDLLVIHPIQRFELRRVPACYANARIVSFHPGRCASGTLILGAQEEHPIASPRGELHKPGNQVRSGDAFLERPTHQVGGPDKRHTIWQYKIAATQNLVQLVIMDGLD